MKEWRNIPRDRGEFPRPILRVRPSNSAKQPFFTMYRDGKTFISGVAVLSAIPDLVAFALSEKERNG